MFQSLRALTHSLRRVAATDRGMVRELRRVADALEARSTGGVALRTFYRDDRPGAVDEASLLMQTDADFAHLEHRERLQQARGTPPTLDDPLEDDEPEEVA